MAYNNYGYGYSYPQYNTNMGYQNYQQPTIQNRDIPFTESYYGTMKEAEAYIVPPMKSVLFINKANNEIYVKSADAMGNPAFETFKRVGIEEPPKQPAFDTEMFVKKETFENALNSINEELKQIREKTLIEDMKGV